MPSSLYNAKNSFHSGRFNKYNLSGKSEIPNVGATLAVALIS
jgi:hypothetical protein